MLYIITPNHSKINKKNVRYLPMSYYITKTIVYSIMFHETTVDLPRQPQILYLQHILYCKRRKGGVKYVLEHPEHLIRRSLII